MRTRVVSVCVYDRTVYLCGQTVDRRTATPPVIRVSAFPRICRGRLFASRVNGPLSRRLSRAQSQHLWHRCRASAATVEKVSSRFAYRRLKKPSPWHWHISSSVAHSVLEKRFWLSLKWRPLRQSPLTRLKIEAWQEYVTLVFICLWSAQCTARRKANGVGFLIVGRH